MVHPACQSPFFVVLLLRLLEESSQAVHLVLQVVNQSFVEQFLVSHVHLFGEPRVFPHAVDPSFRTTIGDVGHEAVCGGAQTLLRPDAVVVVVGDVVIPQRSEIEQRVGLFLIEIGAVETIDVGAYLGAEIPVDERFFIHHVPISADGVGEVARPQSSFKHVDIVVDVGILQGVDVLLVRVVYAYGGVVVVGCEAVAVLETIHLQQVAARDVGVVGQRHFLFDDIHTMGAHFNLVADLVVSLILPVEHHIHELGGGIELQRCELTQSRSQRVSHERLVGSIGKQRPFLGLRISFAQQFLLLLELDSIRFLRHVPRGVAASANLHRVVGLQMPLVVHEVDVGVDVSILAVDGHVVERLDVHGRQVGDLVPLGKCAKGNHHQHQEQDKYLISHCNTVVLCCFYTIIFIYTFFLFLLRTTSSDSSHFTIF